MYTEYDVIEILPQNQALFVNIKSETDKRSINSIKHLTIKQLLNI
jgi:hypothetical protein